jgi:hypothetical protein
MTYAIINTKSNYENLNGKRLKVVENNLNFITCEFIRDGKIVKADFGKSEVVKVYTPVNLHHICNSCEDKGWIWLTRGKQTDCPKCN